MRKLINILLIPVFASTALFASEEPTPPPTSSEDCHIWERLVVSFPEDEQSNWENVRCESGNNGYVFEKWRRGNRCALENFTIVTSPWGEEGPLDVVNAVETIAKCFKGHVEVIRRSKSEEEIMVALHFRNSWKFLRVITTPYALHIASYSYHGNDKLDPELYLDKIQEYAYLVY